LCPTKLFPLFRSYQRAHEGLRGLAKTGNNSISGENPEIQPKSGPIEKKEPPKDAKTPHIRKKTVAKGRRRFYSKIRLCHTLIYFL